MEPWKTINELKYGQIAIFERHTLGLGFKKKKKKNFGLIKKTYQSKIQNQIERESPLSLGHFLYIYILSTLNLSLSL